MTKVWVTRYALSAGIKAFELEEAKGEMAIVKSPGSINGRDFFHGRDWHETEEAARIRANQMRLKKIETLQKQIEKLLKKDFLAPMRRRGEAVNEIVPGSAQDRCSRCGGRISIGHVRGSDCRPRCERCNGTGWLDAIGPKSDGSYITSRPCPNCDGYGSL